MRLFLQAVDVTGPLKWWWLLTDEETGTPLAGHAVDLESDSDEVARFAGLYEYESWNAAPDQRIAAGIRFADAAGEWAGRELLGEPVVRAIAAAAAAGPVTVRVAAPPEVLQWPLELAHADGRPLAGRGDVTFVYDIAGTPGTGSTGHSAGGSEGPLRILAVFSQPTKTSVLALRRERRTLSQLIHRITERDGAAVELRVVQYGITREALAEIAADGDGWDILHMSGHGATDTFLLEKSDGSPDAVPAADLVALLRPARRVRFAVLSACKSADATAQTYRLLGLTSQAAQPEAGTAQPVTARPGTGIPGLAQALVREFGCAVVAMRYPVSDEFAVAFGKALYERLLSRRQPVDVAFARAVAAAGSAPSAWHPAISLATPGLFGGSAVGLRIAVPHGSPVMDPAGQKMAYFDEPARFVGRAEEMAKAGAALAPDSGTTAVILHGMAGAGKTACALELAYRHRDSFATLAFWQAPTRDDEWESALPDFARRLDEQLVRHGLTIAGHIGTEGSLRAFLPRLRSVMAEDRILLVLDNLETLLTPDGAWHDPLWALLITALTSHAGKSRTILTTRIPPAALVTGQWSGCVVMLPVHALSLAESAVLARELPNLRRLLHADPVPAHSEEAGTPDGRPEAVRPGDAQGADAEGERDDRLPESPVQRARTEAADRRRVWRVLRVVQGHPKLMEMADKAAADRARLDAHLASAEKAAADHGQANARGLDAFFRDGKSSLDPEQFLDALTTWTVTTLGALSPEARIMAQFAACLEDSDRVPGVVGATWPDLWHRLRCPLPELGSGIRPRQPAAAVGDLSDVPEPAALLAALAASALVDGPVAAHSTGGDAAPGDGPGDRGGARPAVFRMHPGVADAITAHAGPEIREAVAAELAAYWKKAADEARGREGGEDSAMVVRAGLAAAPYLLRLENWGAAGALLEHAYVRDASPANVRGMLAPLRRIVAATDAPLDAGRLGLALSTVDPVEAERLLRGVMAASAVGEDYRSASLAAIHLAELLLNGGRTEDAREAAAWAAQYVEQGRFGPWAWLAIQAWRLKILDREGEKPGQVLAEVDRLRADMAALPGHADDDGVINPWDVRESLLDTGRSSALATGEWQRSLDLNAELIAIQGQRNASLYEVTCCRMRDAQPLAMLGRLEEAERLMAHCQLVFTDRDMNMLARVFNGRACLEYERERWQPAADLGRDALRMFYAWADPEAIAEGHCDLANFLGRLSDRAGQRAHRLAGALIFRLAGMDGRLGETVCSLADELREDDDAEGLPTTVAQVVAVTERTEGVRLGTVLNTWQPDPQAVDEVLAEILRKAASAMD